MIKKRRFTDIFNPKDESFFATELLFEKVAGIYNIKKQRNPLYKTLLQLEHQAKGRHSATQRVGRWMDKFKRTNYIDTPIHKIRKKLESI
jgi:hypothetical protein